MQKPHYHHTHIGITGRAPHIPRIIVVSGNPNSCLGLGLPAKPSPWTQISCFYFVTLQYFYYKSYKIWAKIVWKLVDSCSGSHESKSTSLEKNYSLKFRFSLHSPPWFLPKPNSPSRLLSITVATNYYVLRFCKL